MISDAILSSALAIAGGAMGSAVLWGMMRAQLKTLTDHASGVTTKLDTLLAQDAHAAAQLAVHASLIGAAHERVGDIERRVRALETKPA